MQMRVWVTSSKQWATIRVRIDWVKQNKNDVDTHLQDRDPISEPLPALSRRVVGNVPAGTILSARTRVDC